LFETDNTIAPATTLLSLNSTTSESITDGSTLYYSLDYPENGPSSALLVSVVLLNAEQSVITVYLNKDNLASPTCYNYNCSAVPTASSGSAFCNIVVDPCNVAPGFWGITITSSNTTGASTSFTLKVASIGTVIFKH
jgi:hypothetical protein